MHLVVLARNIVYQLATGKRTFMERSEEPHEKWPSSLTKMIINESWQWVSVRAPMSRREILCNTNHEFSLIARPISQPQRNQVCRWWRESLRKWNPYIIFGGKRKQRFQVSTVLPSEELWNVHPYLYDYGSKLGTPKLWMVVLLN